MKITANEIKPGMIIEHKNDYWNVLKTQHVKPGKGGAFAQVEMKSLNKNTKLNERFRSSETIEKANIEEKKFNYSYKDDNNFYFIDPKSFEQIEIKKNIIGDKGKLLSENLEISTCSKVMLSMKWQFSPSIYKKLNFFSSTSAFSTVSLDLNLSFNFVFLLTLFISICANAPPFPGLTC